ncbi:hypothetical protein OKW37_007912 [Paraburkholderia sp. MM5482-R2]
MYRAFSQTMHRRFANGVRHGASLSSNQILLLIQRLDRRPESQSRTPAGRDELVVIALNQHPTVVKRGHSKGS